MPESLEIDLRQLPRESWCTVWGASLGEDVAARLRRSLEIQVEDPNHPLLPDLTATLAPLEAAIRSKDFGVLRLVLPARLGDEVRFSLAALCSRLEDCTRIETLDSSEKDIGLCAIPEPDAATASEQVLTREGRGSEVILLPSLSATRQAGALMQVGRPADAAQVHCLEASPLGMRQKLLALRASGQTDRLPAAWRTLARYSPKTPLAQAWHAFDCAVASCVDPVRYGYLDHLARARCLAWGHSAQLDAAIALWGATYHFHSGDFRAALAGHMVGLAKLRDLGALKRAVHVAHRAVHLNWSSGRPRAATALARRTITEARHLGFHAEADHLVLACDLWRQRRGHFAPLDQEFRSPHGPGFEVLRRVASGDAPLSASPPRPGDRMEAEALLTRILTGRDGERAAVRLSECLQTLAPVDRSMLLLEISRARV